MPQLGLAPLGTFLAQLGSAWKISAQTHYSMYIPCFQKAKNLTILLIFSGYCGIQYNAYSATNPDSFVLDDVTTTSVNVSCNTFLNPTRRVGSESDDLSGLNGSISLFGLKNAKNDFLGLRHLESLFLWDIDH